MNFLAWFNFFGQCLLAYLAIEGVKAIAFGLRSPARLSWRVGLNLLAGAAATFFIVPGSGLFPWTGPWLFVAVVVGALVTAGIHRVVKQFRPGAAPLPIEQRIEHLGSRPVMRLGETCLALNLISQEQLNMALDTQRLNRKKLLGRILVEMGAVDERTLTSVLAKQLDSNRPPLSNHRS